MSVEAHINAVNHANQLTQDGEAQIAGAYGHSAQVIEAIASMQTTVDELLANPVFQTVADMAPQAAAGGEKIDEAKTAYYAAFADQYQPGGLSQNRHAQEAIEHIDVASETVTGPEGVNINLQTLAATLGALAGHLIGAKKTLNAAQPFAHKAEDGLSKAGAAAHLAEQSGEDYIRNLGA